MRDQLCQEALDKIEVLMEHLDNVRQGLEYYEDGLTIVAAPVGELADLLSLVTQSGRSWQAYQETVRPIKNEMTRLTYEAHLANVKKKAASKQPRTELPDDELVVLDPPKDQESVDSMIAGVEMREALPKNEAANFIEKMNHENRDLVEGHYAS